MKKILIGLFIISSVAFAKLKDGEYYVEAEKPVWGWKPFAFIVVKDGEIVQFKYDRKDKNNKNATEDEGYNKSMAKQHGFGAKEAVEKLEGSFMASKDVDKVDDIAGATTSSKEFKVMMKYLLKQAESGEPGSYKIKNEELK